MPSNYPFQTPCHRRFSIRISHKQESESEEPPNSPIRRMTAEYARKTLSTRMNSVENRALSTSALTGPKVSFSDGGRPATSFATMANTHPCSHRQRPRYKGGMNEGSKRKNPTPTQQQNPPSWKAFAQEPHTTSPPYPGSVEQKRLKLLDRTQSITLP